MLVPGTSMKRLIFVVLGLVSWVFCGVWILRYAGLGMSLLVLRFV
jgi:hypothetical protein